MDEARDRKFRQAAFGYLIVGILYESGVWVVWKNGLLPAGRGSVWVWLAIGETPSAAGLLGGAVVLGALIANTLLEGRMAALPARVPRA